MNRIEFVEEDFSKDPMKVGGVDEYSGRPIIGFLIKKKIVKDERTAKIVLWFVIGLLIIASIFFMNLTFNNKTDRVYYSPAAEGDLLD